MNWLRELFTLRLPGSLAPQDNPVYDYSVRDSGADIDRRARRFLLSCLFIGVMLRLIPFALDYASNGRFAATQNSSGNISSDVILIVLFIGITVDIVTLVISANGEYLRPSAKRDQLILTGMSSSKIVAAAHALAVLRGWRFCALEMTLRFVIMTSIGLNAVIIFGLQSRLVFAPLFFTLSYLFVLEPYWRMRAVAAGGIRAPVQGSQVFRLGSSYMRVLIFTTLGQVVSLASIGMAFAIAYIVLGLVLRTGTSSLWRGDLISEIMLTILATLLIIHRSYAAHRVLQKKTQFYLSQAIKGLW